MGRRIDLHAKVFSLAMKTLPGKALHKYNAYYTATKSFTGVMLRQTNANQAHLNILRINFSKLYMANWLNVFITPKFLQLRNNNNNNLRVLEGHCWVLLHEIS